MHQEVMRNKNISPEAKAIYAYLSSIAGLGQTCYPSLDTMQVELAMSKGRLTKYLGELIACGVVEKKREMNGNLYGRNVYKVTHEAEVAEDMKRIFRAVENRAIEIATVENRLVENLATNNNNTNNNSINNINVCSEPKKTPDPSGILLPLNNGSMYDVPLSKIEEWKAAFPAVDVEQELRKMITWLNSNPERKKTSRGVNRFINNWLSKEQDKGGRFRAGSSSKVAVSEPIQTRFHNFEQHQYESGELDKFFVNQ